MKKNDEVRLTIDGMNDMGNGVAHVDGKAVFVTGAVVGDEVLARVIKVTPGYLVARTERVLSPSPNRIENDCNAVGCGGCAYRLISYEKELEFKRNDVVFAFKKAGIPDAVVRPVLSTGETHGYRNKAQYPVGVSKDGTPIAGFYASRSHRVVSATACPLQAPTFSPIAEAVLSFVKEKGISVYDEESGRGLLRHLYFRGNTKGEVLLTLVVNGEGFSFAEELVTKIAAEFPHVVGILLNENKKKTNVICGDVYRTLYGKSVLTDVLSGVPLSIAPQAFYQVNHDATELLYRTARELAAFTGEEILLDLYCGIGSVGLSMASAVRKLVGIEIVPEAVECAKENARRAGIDNAHFFVGDAANTEGLLKNAERELGKFSPDVVVLDPPRKGCDGELLSFLSERLAPKRIVYISCNPDTLARDVAVLTRAGYEMGEVTPVDLFPRTGHVESVVCLTRK